MDCEYTSREYQVALRTEFMASSFKTAVSQVLDELTKIEQAQAIEFKVSVSSLKFKNVSVTEYILPVIRSTTDVNVPLRFKSRQKKASEPADIVMKTSNADPELACWPLKVSVFLIFSSLYLKQKLLGLENSILQISITLCLLHLFLYHS
jgi:hypothetical protein